MPTDNEGIGSLNIEIVNANTLDILNNPSSEYSLILVNRVTNKGVLLNYASLFDTIVDKVYSNQATDDSLKLYVIE